MFIEIHQLELQPLDFEEEYPAGTIDFGPDITQREVFRLPSRRVNRGASRETSENKGHTTKGEVGTALELACARCLEPVVEQVSTVSIC